MRDSTRRFSNRVENYIRYRPGYPPAVLRFLEERGGLRPEHSIADVGSGTGKLSELFLENGNPVIGIEPNLEMRAAAERRLGSHPRFTSRAGTAESTGLEAASVDWVVAGQAFHWFDRERARREFRRILAPAGWVALVWNERRLDSTPFLRDYESLLLRRGTDYREVRHREVSGDALRSSLRLRDYAEACFRHHQSFDREGLIGRTLSSSYAPESGEPGHSELLEELDELYRRHQQEGRVAFEYDCRLYLGRPE